MSCFSSFRRLLGGLRFCGLLLLVLLLLLWVAMLGQASASLEDILHNIYLRDRARGVNRMMYHLAHLRIVLVLSEELLPVFDALRSVCQLMSEWTEQTYFHFTIEKATQIVRPVILKAPGAERARSIHARPIWL